MDKIRGINLGNWLVLEKWMCTDVFQDSPEADEVWLTRTTPPEELRERLKKHRDTYITEDDFQLIRSKGFNLVRLPAPFFVFDDRPPFTGCITYVDKALEWAENSGVQVLIDLHTVPGGQNGYDNGGHTGVCKWHKNPDEVVFALTVLERLAQRYGTRKGLYGIEVLNEPISFSVYMTAGSTGKAKDKEEAKGSGHIPLSFLKQFYQDAYSRIRAYMPEEKTVVFSDGFRLGSWGNFFNQCGMKNVMLDTHIYIYAMEAFIPIPAWWIYKAYVDYNVREIQRAAKYTPVMVGEWTAECRRPFQLAGKNGKTEDEQVMIRQQEYQKVCRMQKEAWECSAGWVYWSYQLDRDPEGRMRLNEMGHKSMEAWAMRRLWRHGWWSENEQ